MFFFFNLIQYFDFLFVFVHLLLVYFSSCFVSVFFSFLLVNVSFQLYFFCMSIKRLKKTKKTKTGNELPNMSIHLEEPAAYLYKAPSPFHIHQLR